MRLQVYKDKDLDEDKIDIFCREETERIESIITYIKEANMFTLIGYIGGKDQVLEKNQVLYFESVDKKTYAYTKTQVYNISSTLAELENKIEGESFVRINKSTIVNLYKVISIKADLNMRTIVTLVNKEKLIITRHYNKLFKKRLYSLRDQIKGVKNENN